MLVSRKCPRWFVASCDSYPSLVLASGHAMIPVCQKIALLAQHLGTSFVPGAGVWFSGEIVSC